MDIKMIQCKECNTENTEDLYFCKKCGAFLKGEELGEASLFTESEKKMKRVMSNLEQVPHFDIDWNQTVDKYTARVEQLKALFELKELDFSNINKTLTDDMMQFLEHCRNPEFQIAFVGTIKTGKSTLINALLGKNYASMDVTPETAALTKFRYSEKDYVKVTFYSTNEWTALWKSRTKGADKFVEEYKQLKADSVKERWVGHTEEYKEVGSEQICEELARWSSSKYPEHYFVKEIEAGISSLPANFPSAVVFVDTPGLSDPVAYRSEITRQYIRRANAVFVCVDAQKIYKEEVETISSVFSFSSDNKSKVFIVATHWDQLNDPENDWNEKQRPYLEKTLVGPGFFPDAKIASSNIMHSSAYYYNLFRDFDSTNDYHIKQLCIFSLKMGGSPIPGEALHDLELFKEKTNVNNIMHKITDVLAKRYEILLTGQLGETYEKLLHDLRRIGEEKAEQEKALIQAGGQNYSDVKKQLEEQKQNQFRIKEVQRQLLAVLDSVKQKSQEPLTDILKKIDEYLDSQE